MASEAPVPSSSAPAGALPGMPDLFRSLTHVRHCTRAFLRDKPVPREIIEDVLTLAACAPSSQDSQPWRVCVLTGAARDSLSAALLRAHESGVEPQPDYVNRPAPEHMSPLMAKCVAAYGETFFEIQGLARDDKAGRHRSRGRNFEFFDAPTELILYSPAPTVAGMFIDVGAYLANVLMGFAAYGVGACPQYAVASLAPIVKRELGLEGAVIICGIAVGYADPTARINTYLAPRVALSEFVSFHEEAPAAEK